MGLFSRGSTPNMKQSERSDLKKEVRERAASVDPIVRKILEMVNVKNLPIGEFTNADEKVYDDVAKEILQLMLENDMKFSNKEFVFQLALQPLDKLRDRVVNSLKITFDDMVERAVGKSNLDVTLGDMDKIIKSQIVKN